VPEKSESKEEDAAGDAQAAEAKTKTTLERNYYQNRPIENKVSAGEAPADNEGQGCMLRRLLHAMTSLSTDNIDTPRRNTH
jgi:hypothetical protein